MVFQLRVCVLRESSCLGLCLSSLFVPGREGEGVKFVIQLRVDFAAVIFLSVNRLNRCQRKKRGYTAEPRQVSLF